MTTNFKKIVNNIPLLFLIIIFFALLKDADLVLKSSINAATLFFTKLFPCMFIFYTLQDLLLNYGILKVFIKFFSPLSKKLFHLDACSSYIIFMSMLTGFPSGSKYVTDFYNKKYIDRNTANYLLTFTHFSNPLFILGTVSVITTKNMALIILLSHFLSNFVVAFFTRPKLYIEKSIPQTREKKSLTACLNDSFQNTFSIVKIVFCTTIFFVVIITLFTSFIPNTYLKTILFGLFDLTKGVTEVNKLSLTMYQKGILICSFISLGGVSVHMQVQSIIAQKKLSYPAFLKGRIASTGINLLLYTILCSCIL